MYLGEQKYKIVRAVSVLKKAYDEQVPFELYPEAYDHKSPDDDGQL